MLSAPPEAIAEVVDEYIPSVSRAQIVIDEIWYPGIDHGLAGVEAQVARDLLAWMGKIGVLQAAALGRVDTF